MGKFATDTAVQPARDGAYTCQIGADWWVMLGPNGGYLAAIAVRALQDALDPGDRPLRSLTVHYMRAPQAGPATVEVVPEREGGSVTFARLRMIQDDQPFATALAVLARGRESMTLDTAKAPDIPPPDEIQALPDSDQAPPFARNFDYRPAAEPPVAGEAVTGGWLRLRDDEELDAALVVALCDSWFPAIFSVVPEPMAVPTLDLTVHLRDALPRPGDWVLARVTTRTVGDGLLEEDAELFGSDGRLLAQSRQLALAR